LELPRGPYLAEKYRMHLVVSGADLLRSGKEKKDELEPPVVLADPAFDLDEGKRPEGPAPGARARRDSSASPASPLPVANRMRGLLVLPAHLERLPGTEAEARAVLPHLERYSG